jgi:hypothetical protein
MKDFWKLHLWVVRCKHCGAEHILQPINPTRPMDELKPRFLGGRKTLECRVCGQWAEYKRSEIHKRESNCPPGALGSLPAWIHIVQSFCSHMEA